VRRKRASRVQTLQVCAGLGAIAVLLAMYALLHNHHMTYTRVVVTLAFGESVPPGGFGGGSKSFLIDDRDVVGHIVDALGGLEKSRLARLAAFRSASPWAGTMTLVFTDESGAVKEVESNGASWRFLHAPRMEPEYTVADADRLEGLLHPPATPGPATASGEGARKERP